MAGDSGALQLFKERPIELEGFKLLARSVQPVGKPSPEAWVFAVQFADAAHTAAPYWIGDLMVYAESRGDWDATRDQLIALTGLTLQTIYNYTSLARRVREPERLLAPSVGHAEAIAALPRDEQRKMLKAAATEGWTRNDLRNNIRAEKRTKIIEGQAILEGMFRVIYADCPWVYRDSNATADGSLGKAERHYAGMSVDELCKLPVQAHATPDAILFSWVPAPLLPLGLEVMGAWGFTYKTNIVWDKVRGMPGHYGLQVKHEHLLIGVRGKNPLTDPTPHDDSVQTIRREGEHSEKPEDFRALIMRHYKQGPYLELFGRRKVKGWTVFGNDARLWTTHEGGMTG